ncbi:choice-of-anchor tandem repeat GloVer-containing protein [Ideonella sp. YS5]|uniref:choice-of-anchor tandem repeat GloVer-containing protein n=1 Tax=Ideonella sp. YS5 TaxID=3453714 RepID=UPI003EEBB326
MSNTSQLRRQLCFGLGMGLASPMAMSRGLPDRRAPPGHAGVEASGRHYRTVHHLGDLEGSEVDAGLLLATDGKGYGTAALGGSHGLGTVYRIGAGKNLKVVHHFASPSRGGAHPVAPVIEVDGALYGVTAEGGAAGAGVAFRWSHDTGYAVLHDFGGAPDGRLCWGGLLFASDGFFYGGTYFGGDHDAGVVYRMDKAGTVTPLWQLGAAGDPSLVMAAPIEGADGYLYGTSRAGGAHDGGTVYRLAKDGSDREVIFSFDGSHGSVPAVPLLETADGSLYSVTTFGGASDAGTVFRLRPDGTHTVLHEFTGGPDGREPNTELLMIEPGVFVGTTTFGGGHGFGSGVVYQIRDDGGFQRLHAFGGTVDGLPDGARPSGALLRLADGQVVGTCRGGGVSDQGTIWKLTPALA